MSALTADVRARVGGFALDAAIRAEPGEILAILGPNGAGKSTLLGAIAGHVRDVTGAISLGDIELHAADGRRVPPEHRRVGLLGQRSILFPHLSVLENVAFGPRSQGMRRSDARAEAGRLLEEVGLAGFESRRPSQLSGGQQQRAAIARALAANPGALLLDEPFAGLDAQTAAHARRLIAELRDRRGIPMILVTHDVLDAVVLADRTTVLQGGAVVQDGTTRDVLGHPGSAFVAALAGVNLVSGRADFEGRLVLDAAEGPALLLPAVEGAREGDELSAAFAPGAVRVRNSDAPRPDAAIGWTGSVHTLEPIPGGIRITTTEHPEIAVDCSSSAAVEVGLRPGARLSFALLPTDVSVRLVP
ncbi:ABC transporter ATP-binding protein [Microbacterium sp. A204]|uniref:ABC transporter ATP-binding protein n=1 Tax=Microbacterium sp. A204 TaxID=3457321 RepID=UPI003FD690BB